MSTYCTNADLVKVFADVGSYDRKVVLPEHDFILSGSAVWMLYNSGPVGVLYRDGENIAAGEQTDIGDVTSEKDWYYDSTLDILYVYSAAETPSSYRWHSAPESWADAQTTAIANASEYLESMLDVRFPRPLPKSGTGYDYVIIRACAMLAVIDLVQATDPELPIIASLREQLWNEQQTGILDRLNAGKIKLGFERTHSDAGEIAERSVGEGSTGYPTDPRGGGSSDYELIVITIVTGGTLTAGTENTEVTYKCTDSQGNETVSETLITGYHQSTGLCDVRFVPGVYKQDDTWTLTSTGHDPGTGSIRLIEATR